MWTFTEHFVQLVMRSDGLSSRRDLTGFRAGLPRLSGRDTETCERSITPQEMMERMATSGVVRHWI